MIASRIDGQSHHLHISPIKLRLNFSHVTEFRRADRSEVLRVREKNGPRITDPIVETDSALGGYPSLFRHEPHCLLRFLQADHEVIIYDRFHSVPHAREHALAARAINEGGFPIFEHLRRTHFEGERSRRGCLRLNPENFCFCLERLDRTANTGDKSAATNAGNDRRRIWCVLENLQSHRSVARDEVVVVEWMNECSVGPRK